jgi:hypothetical protein
VICRACLLAACWARDPQELAPALISSGSRSAHGQPSATNIKTPTRLSWGFLRAIVVLPRCCGFLRKAVELASRPSRQSAFWPVLGHLSLSPGYSSLRHYSPRIAQSPQRRQFDTTKINSLRARTDQAVVHRASARDSETAPSRRVENAGIPPIGTADTWPRHRGHGGRLRVVRWRPPPIRPVHSAICRCAASGEKTTPHLKPVSAGHHEPCASLGNGHLSLSVRSAKSSAGHSEQADGVAMRMRP